MANHLLRQANFSGGELAPLARGRVDLAAYATGLRLALNFLPTLEGPLLNRPGSRFVCAVKDSSYAPRLISFKFTDGQNFILEVGDRYIRFVQNGAQVLSAEVLVAPAWDPTITYAAGDQALFVYAPIGGPAVPALFRSKVGGNLNHTPPGVVGSDAFWEVLFHPYEVATPWLIADVPRLDFAQDGDVITFTHPSYAPQELRRLSNTNWTVAPVNFTPLAATAFLGSARVVIASNIGGLGANAAIAPDNWDPTHTYSVGDFVVYDDGGVKLFLAKTTTTGSAPSSIGPNPWQDITFGTSPFLNQNIYVWNVGDALYISLQSHNTASPPGTSLQFAIATGDTRIATSNRWVVTALWRDAIGRRHETLPSDPTQDIKVYVAQDRPATIQWSFDASTAPGFVLLGWNIYRGDNGIFGLVGSLGPDTGASSPFGILFIDKAPVPNFGIQPPKGTNPFDIATGANTKTQSWPGVVTYHEQRIVYARSNKKPQEFFGSAVNNFTNFDVNTPVVDSDQYDWRVSSKDLAEIRHLIPLRYLLALTSSGVFGGYGPAGAITPNGINLRPYHQPGASYLAPVVVENGAVYQTKKNRLRDLIWNWQVDGYVGRDLSLVARHFFDGGLSIVDMTYAETPFSLVYAPRSDGALLTLTYSPGGGVSGWARHTTRGSYERVASCEEADPDTGVIEDAVYCVVKRTVNGATVRYIERFSSRLLPTLTRQTMNADGTPALDDFGNPVFETVDDLRRGNFLDCSVEYDGRNTNDDSDHTFGIFSLIGIVAGQQVQLGTITGFFSAADIGKVVVLDPDAVLNGPYLFRIVAIAAGMATVEALGSYTTLAADFPSGFTASWGLAVTNLAGLDHLEGLSVSVLADGGADGPYIVAGGAITLTEPAVIAQVGLPYVSDMETLDIAAEAVRTNEKIIKAVTLDVVASRGILVGQDFKPSSLVTPAAFRTADPVANVAPAAVTGITEANIPSSSTKGGRVCVRQVEPLPLSILAVIREIKVDGR